MPNIRWLLALITRLHRFLYRLTGGRIGARLGGKDMLLLTTTGRKSGASRTLPLLYVPDGDRLLVVGSNAGDDRSPAWWLNLQANPRAVVQVGPEVREIEARQADSGEAALLWPKLLAAYPSYADYLSGTSREIPIVVLERP